VDAGALRVEGELFAAKAGHVTDWHIDYMENFTIHLRGRCYTPSYHCTMRSSECSVCCGPRKRWRMKQGKLSHPLRGASSHYKGIHSVEKQANVRGVKLGLDCISSEVLSLVPLASLGSLPAGFRFHSETERGVVIM
jgi:hypothetical protein